MADSVAQQLAMRLRARGFSGADFQRATGIDRAVFNQIARNARSSGYGRAYRDALQSALSALEGGMSKSAAGSWLNEARRPQPIGDEDIPEFGGQNVVQPPETMEQLLREAAEGLTPPTDTRDIIAKSSTGFSEKDVTSDLGASFEWIDVDSSRVQRIGYSADAQVIRVVFVKYGTKWEYRQVPPGIWEAFRSSDSHGKYINTHLNSFPHGEADF